MKWTENEDQLIIKLYNEFGPRWSTISHILLGRSENMVKNRFYSHIKKVY